MMPGDAPWQRKQLSWFEIKASWLAQLRRRDGWMDTAVQGGVGSDKGFQLDLVLCFVSWPGRSDHVYLYTSKASEKGKNKIQATDIL